MALSRVADRAFPSLLAVFLVATTFSISAAQITLGLLALCGLCRLLDPGLRAAHRAPLLAPVLTFAGLTLLSAAFSASPARGFFEAKDLLLMATFYLAVNGFSDRDRTMRLLQWLFGAVAIVSIYGLIQLWACQEVSAVAPWGKWLLRISDNLCQRPPYFRAKGFFSIYMTYAGMLLLAGTLMLGLLAFLPLLMAVKKRGYLDRPGKRLSDG
jgi:hypothetical protein